MTADIERIYNKDLLGLSQTGRACEACGGDIRKHEWADLDEWGFAVRCPETERIVARLAMFLHNEFCKDRECLGVLDYLDSARNLAPKIKSLLA